MKRFAAFALVAAGAVLLALGIQASSSHGSGASRFFTGAPTHETTALLVGGAAALAAGLFSVSL